MSYGTRGTHRHNVSKVKFAEQISSKLTKADADAVGLSVKDFTDKTRDDWWLYGKNAVDENAADDVTMIKCSKSLINKRIKKTKRMMIFSVTYEVSACPLIRGPLKTEVTKSGTPTKEQQDALNYFLTSINTSEFISQLRMGLIRPKMWF